MGEGCGPVALPHSPPGNHREQTNTMAAATKNRASHKVYVIKSPSVIPWNGTDYNFGPHTLIHEDHPIRVKYPELFTLVRLSYDVEDATAEPGTAR